MSDLKALLEAAGGDWGKVRSPLVFTTLGLVDICYGEHGDAIIIGHAQSLLIPDFTVLRADKAPCFGQDHFWIP